MRLIFGNKANPAVNQYLCWWANSIIWPGQTKVDFSTTGSMGVIDGDCLSRLIAVVLFQNYEPQFGRIELGVASISPRWLTSEVIQEVAANCFERFDCQLVYACTAETNHKAHKLMKRIGFKSVLLPRMRGHHEGERHHFMTREAWTKSPLRRRIFNVRTKTPKGRLA